MVRMLGLLLALAVFVVPYVAALTTPTEANVVQGAAETYTTTPADQNVSVVAGNVYQTDISVESLTQWWAGLYGTITETVVLGSGTSKFYEWPVSTITGYVYITTGTTVDWANASTTVSTTEVNTALGGAWNPGADENFEATFEVNTAVAGNYCSDANAPFTLTYDNTGTGTWPTCAYWDSLNSVLILEAKINQGGTSFKGTTVDYQALVPATTGGVTYYIWKG